MTIWSLLSSSSGVSPSRTRTDFTVGGLDGRLPELGEGVGGDEGRDLVADEALDRPGQGTARIWARSGSASLKISWGSISWLSWSVR